MRTRIVGSGVLLGCLLMVIVGAGFTTPALAADDGLPTVSGKLRFAYLPSSSLGPLFYAADKHWPELGFDVESFRQPSGADVLSMVVTGDADIGAGALGAAAFNAISQGLPVKFVAPLHFERAEEYMMISNRWRERGVDDIADLKGRPVVINGKGVVTEYLLQLSLAHGGLTVDDVQLGTMGFPDMVTALETGAVVGAILTQPFAAQAMLRDVGFMPVAHLDTEYIPMTVVFINTDWAERNPELAVAALVGYLQATRDIIEMDAHEGDYLTALQKFTPVADEVFQSFKPAKYNANGELDIDKLMEQQRFNLTRGYLDYSNPIPIADLYDPTYLEAALELVGYSD